MSIFLVFDSSVSVNQAARSDGYVPFWSENLQDHVYVKDFTTYHIVDEGHDYLRDGEVSQMAGCWVELSPCIFPQDAQP